MLVNFVVNYYALFMYVMYVAIDRGELVSGLYVVVTFEFAVGMEVFTG